MNQDETYLGGGVSASRYEYQGIKLSTGSGDVIYLSQFVIDTLLEYIKKLDAEMEATK